MKKITLLFVLTGCISFGTLSQNQDQSKDLGKDAVFIAQNLNRWHAILIDNLGCKGTSDSSYIKFKEKLNDDPLLNELMNLFKPKSNAETPYKSLNKESFVRLNNSYNQYLKSINKKNVDTLINNAKANLNNNEEIHLKLKNFRDSIKDKNKKQIIMIEDIQTNSEFLKYSNLPHKLIKLEHITDTIVKKNKNLYDGYYFLDSLQIDTSIISNDTIKKYTKGGFLKDQFIREVERNLLTQKRNLDNELVFLYQLKMLLQDGKYDLETYSKHDKKALNSVTYQVSDAVKNTDYSFDGIEMSKFKIPSQSDLIDAVAIFIANRFREEVALTFVDKLRNNIASDSLLKIVFPKTNNLINSISIYTNPSFGKSWKEAFAYDLANLPQNLASYISPKTHSNNNLFNSDYFKFYATIIQMLDELKRGSNFFDIVSLTIENTPFEESEKQKVSYKLLQLIDYLNNNFRTYNSDRYFVTFREWNELTKNTISRKYLETVFRRDLSEILTPSSKPIDTDSLFRYDIPHIIVKYNRLEQVLRDAHKNQTNGKENGTFGLYQYWNAMEDLIKETSNLFEDKKAIDKYVEVVNTTIEIQKSIEAKNFGLMINHSTQLLGQLINKEKSLNNSDFEILLRQKYSNNQRKFRIIYDTYTKFDSLSIVKTNIDTFLRQHSLIEHIDNKNKTFYLVNDYFNSLHKHEEKTASYLKSIKNESDRDKIDAFIKETVYKNFSEKYLSDIIGHVRKKKSKNSRFNKLFNYYLYTKLFDIKDEDSAFLENNSALVLDRTINTFNFIVDVLTVNNSKDMSKLIASKAAPVSSYKIKRFSRISWDINAYPQLYGGAEILWNNINEVDRYAWTFGFSCPIGLSFSWGTNYKSNNPLEFHKQHTYRDKNGNFHTLKGNAWTVTASLVDLGAVVSFRLAHGENKSLPQEVKIDQFVAPGLFIARGIKKTPMVWKVGIQFTPKLRSFDIEKEDGNGNVISPTEMERQWSDVFRISAGIAVDIPLYNIWNRTKRQTSIFSNL